MSDVNQAHLEKPESLPEGWADSSVSEIVQMVSANNKKLAQKKYLEEGEFPVIDQGQDFIGGYSNDKDLVVEEEPPFIVFGDHTRAFKFANFQFVPGADGVKIMKPLGVDPKWCFYIFQAIKLPNKGYARHFQYLKEAYVPVPPPEQQKRIVAKIEELFSHIDAGIEALKKAKQLLKQYRQSVLKAAVTGELTKKWRLSALAEGRAHAQASELDTLPKKSAGKYFVYIIECDNGSYYVGYSDSLVDRWLAHCEGRGADWTKKHIPKYLIHWEELDSQQAAIKLEQDFKTGYGRTWRKREIEAGRIKPVVHNSNNKNALPVHDTGMQTGSQLLERILKERRQKWEEQQLEQFKAKGKIPKNDKWKEKYKEPKPAALLVDLRNPNEWELASVDQVAEVLLGKMLDKAKHTAGEKLPYLRNINVRWGSIDTDDLLEMFFKDSELERYDLNPGDVLVCEGGEPGRAAVWEEDVTMKYQKALHRVRFYLPLIPQYLVYLLEYFASTGLLERYFTGSTIKHFTKESFITLPFPLPSLQEMETIVEMIDEKVSSVRRLEDEIERQLLKADKNKQSILASAFSGKLIEAAGKPAKNDLVGAA